jgi:hypothetical protein
MTDNPASPMVIHLGKKSRKQIKKYRQGLGTMFLEVQHVLANAKTQAGPDNEVVPTVVVHRRKRKKGLLSGGSRMFGF